MEDRACLRQVRDADNLGREACVSCGGHVAEQLRDGYPQPGPHPRVQLIQDHHRWSALAKVTCTELVRLTFLRHRTLLAIWGAYVYTQPSQGQAKLWWPERMDVL